MNDSTIVESVHLLNWPEAGEINQEILSKMARTREIITEGLALRMNKSETEEQIKVRQPLSEFVYTGEPLGEFYETIITEEVNVKKVTHGERMKLDKNLTPQLMEEGFLRELIRFVQAARKKAGLSVDDRIKLSISVKIGEKWMETLKSETLALELKRGENFAYDEIMNINGENVTISLEKA